MAYADETEVPSLEETLFSVPVLNPAGGFDFPDTRSREVPLLVAPFPLTVLSLNLVFNSSTDSSGSDFWTFNLLRSTAVPPAGNRLIATKDTSGDKIHRDIGWDLSSVLFDPAERKLGVNETLQLQPVPTGSPGNLGGPIIATVRYARQ